MCHALVQNPKFFRLLLRIDQELAAEVRAAGCGCGGVLHCADYPRKPRACPAELRPDFASRLSFCCNRGHRQRATPQSVRFLGPRVYLGLAVVLESTRPAAQLPGAARLSTTLDISIRTLQRWRQWWCEQFPLTALWQAAGARFMPPPAIALFPASLLERFAGNAEEALLRLLVFLRPLTVATPALNEGR